MRWHDASRGDLGVAADLVGVLLQAVDLRSCAKLAVVGGSCDTVAQAVQQRYNRKLWGRDKQPSHALDQVSTAWYRRARLKVQLDWVFACPPEGMLELALGLAVQQVQRGVAMLVRKAVLTNHSSVMAAMLQQFAQQARLVCITNQQCDAAWLVVFASSQLEQAMVLVCGRVHQSGWVLDGMR